MKITAFVAVFGAACSFASAQMKVGMGLDEVTYYSSEWWYADALRQSDAWFSQPIAGSPWSDGGTIRRTAGGGVLLDPGQTAAAQVYRHNITMPVGTYHLTHAGKGKFDVRTGGRIVSVEPGHVTIEMTYGATGILLRVVESDPEDPIRDVELRHASNPRGKFHPLFVERLRGMKVLRFMDPQRINDPRSKQVAFAERAQPHGPQTTVKGVCLEDMVDLCAAVGADMWWCVPVEADDGYVAQAVKLIFSRAPPTMKLYVELSNETWNGNAASGFYGARAIHKRAALAGISPNKLHGLRSAEVFRVAEAAAGGLDRLRRVMATQVVNYGVTTQRLEAGDAYRVTDCLAIAPYFGKTIRDADMHDRYVPGLIDEWVKRTGDVGWSPETIGEMKKSGALAAGLTKHNVPAEQHARHLQVFRDIAQARVAGPFIAEHFPLSQMDGWMAESVKLAERYGVELVCYEAGQHLAIKEPHRSENQALVLIGEAVNRHPAMYDKYAEYLTKLEGYGVTLTVHFKNVYRPTMYGSWGCLEYQDQHIAEAPKYRAILDYMRGHGQLP